MTDVTYRVIADHLRCLVFAITDGALPSNEGRGYVLRRILRRAVRYGRQYFGMTEPFLCNLVPAVVNQLADTFPELRTGPNPKHPRDNATYVADILRDEEVAALEAIRRGEPLWWQAAVRSLKNAKNKSWVLSGPNPPAGEEADVGTVGEQDISRLGLREKLFLYRGSSPVASRVTISFDTFHVDDVRHALSSTPTISGQDAFNLHQTCGFLIDVTVQAAEERGIEVDIDEYERLMEDARERARGASLGKALISRVTGIPEVNLDIITDDSPKYQTKSLEARYLAGWSVGGGNIALAFDRTCFYAEQGGQVGDKGTLCKRNGEYLFGIIDTRQSADVVLHIPDPREFALLEPNGKQMSIDSMYKLKVDDSHRIPTMQNHTATHLLNWSLREVLGTHVQQKGSLVDPEKTRFDFSHNKPLTPDEISRIESHVNERIAAGLTVYAPSREEDFVDRKKALDINTLRAVFGEKYPEKVRVVSIGVPIDDLLADPENPKWMNYSVEFCGGTHVRNTSEIDRFVLTSEEAVAKGVRRLVGLTGSAAQTARRLGSELLAEAKSLAQAIPLPSPERKRRDAHDTPLPQLLADLQSRIESATIPLTTRHRIRALIEDVQRTIKEQSKQAATAAAGDVLTRARELLNDAETVGDTRVIVAEVPPANPDALRGAIDWFRQKTVSSAVLLVCTDGEKVTLLAGMSKDLVKRGLRSGDLIKEIAPLVGGRGGGRPDMAQGGGHNPQAIPEVIQRATEWLHERII